MFVDRREAGTRLAEHLSGYEAAAPIVIGLPRGGVPVAAVVASVLGAPLDIIVVRKLGCPWQPELGFGAVAEGGIRVMNDALVHDFDLTPEELATVTAREEAELERRVRTYRGGRPPIAVDGRVVILVDDGLATGYTARAAVEALRRRRAAKVILAVPVASEAGASELRRHADDVVAVATPSWFLAIGEFYEDFSQTSDEDVIALLEQGAPPRRSGCRRVEQPAGPVTRRAGTSPIAS
ncbi:MAG TPA: phosphoribosyltransferase family protein [Candidatus Limnocylindrales bacterium]|nr:phosphoribosyltransferase family protein [Candidatus Limnocylindrales bacterium]